MKAKWQNPKVLAVGEAWHVFGTCEAGSTENVNFCVDGQSTAVVPFEPHGCTSGGTAGYLFGCSTGSVVINSKP